MIGLNIMVVYNKVDLIEDKNTGFEKYRKQIQNLFKKTKYPNKDQVPVVFFSCRDEQRKESLIHELVSNIIQISRNVQRKDVGEKNLMIVDHCFDIKSKGTVLTGTIIEGVFKEGDEITIPEMDQERVIKSIQSFKRSRKTAQKGDRVAFLVQTVKNELERCYVIKGKGLQLVQCFLAKITFCPYYKFSIKSKGKFHISISHLNDMATMQFFALPKEKGEEPVDFKNPFEYIQEVSKEKITFLNREESLEEFEKKNNLIGVFFLQKPLFLQEENFYLASKFDFQSDQKVC